MSEQAEQTGAAKKRREPGEGRIYRPTYINKRTGERQQSAIWWIEYSVNGKKHWESSKSKRRKNAVGLLNQRQGEANGGRLIGPAALRLILEELIRMLDDDYKINSRKSIGRKDRAVVHIQDFFGLDCRVLNITTDRIRAYIQHRFGEGAMPATIRYEVSLLRRSINLAVQAEKLNRCPHIPSIKVSNARSGFFERAEHEAVVENLPDYLRPVANFAFWSGWRKTEILTICWSQVDEIVGTVRLESGTTKNDEPRILPYKEHEGLRELVQGQIATREMLKAGGVICPWVFNNDGKRIKEFRGAWKSACRKAGVPGRLFHDYRRSAVRNFELNGIPRSVAMKLVGHKTESIYRRYAIVAPQDLADAMSKLSEFHGKEDSQGKVEHQLVQFGKK
ncbi:MAG: tyrosine-type recombinase/integrase [Acidobacteria bacterium]|nr:tyrosine-type recombinase/integrase [Acidobacteriota bacterium]